MTNFTELAKVLALEQSKGFANKSVVGGIEAYAEHWAKRTRTADNATVVQQITELLAGYTKADPAQRKSMIERAVATARQFDATATRPAPKTPHPPREQRGKEGGKPARQGSPARPAPPSNHATHERPNRSGAKSPLPLELRDEASLIPAPEPIPENDDSGDAPALSSRPDFGLDSAITRINGIKDSRATQFARLGIVTVRDLMYHFPRAYRPVKQISELMYGDEATVIAQVSHINAYRTRNGYNIVDIVLMDASGGITAKFFQQPWIGKQLHLRQWLVVSGKIDRDLNKLSFKSPEFEPLTQELQRLLDTARVYPVYPLTEGIKANWLRKLERSVIGFWADKVTDPLPAQVRHNARLMPLPNALREIHFPTSMQAMNAARYRFAFEELLYIQLGVLRQRQLWLRDPAKALNVPPDFIDRFESGLPYPLTGAQKRAIGELLTDIQGTAPMSRLLQGDVGAGKTVVATASLLVAMLNQSQAALLAPTEILAEQHFKTIQKILPALAEKFGVAPRLGLLTGSIKAREKQHIQHDIARGNIDLAIGTHALIQEAVNFQNLTLAVIDEQHRFGVGQRSALRQKGYNPHIYVMSATPIPRTLALTVYGDLDLSILDELPPGRTPIMTKWLEPKERERAYSFLRKQVREGRQAFVICPLIQESETIDAKAAVEEYEHLKTNVFPELRVGLIHGKLRPADKDAVMTEFRDRNLDILVATSVIEVGIDIPNATIMLIEGADRFGLAQLHQFRGRVGRGAHQSYCMLLSEKSGSTSDERLKVIEGTQDGFKLAEADLLMRGPGEFFGTKQSGLPDLKVAQLTDVKLLEQARRVAESIFERDPNFKEPENQLLKKGMNDFWQGEGDLS